MAWPALLSGAAKIVGSAGLWTGATRFFRNAAPKLKSKLSGVFGFIGSNKGASAGAGLLGGWGANELADKLGVEPERLDRVLMVGAALTVIVAIGQLFEIQIGGD